MAKCAGKTVDRCSVNKCQVVNRTSKKYCRRTRRACAGKSREACAKSRRCNYASGSKRRFCRRKRGSASASASSSSSNQTSSSSGFF